jgi:hypothetical protein
MQDLKDKLTVLHTTDGVAFADKSADAFDLLRGSLTVSVMFYVGFRKPVNTLFFAVPTSNSNAGTWTVSYYDGTWKALDAHFDSPSFTESGFVRWLEPASETSIATGGKTLYWYKFTHSTSSSVSLSGIGPLLCSAHDIEDLDFNVDEPSDTKLKAMVAARNYMCKEMQISAWDLLNVPDVSDAATFYALYVLYSNRSDRPDDHYAILASDYLEKYKALKSKVAVTIDRDDDGKQDDGERQTSRTVYFER